MGMRNFKTLEIMNSWYWLIVVSDNNNSNEQTTLPIIILYLLIGMYAAQLFFLLMDMNERTKREILIGLIPIVSFYYVIKKL